MKTYVSVELRQNGPGTRLKFWYQWVPARQTNLSTDWYYVVPAKQKNFGIQWYRAPTKFQLIPTLASNIRV